MWWRATDDADDAAQDAVVARAQPMQTMRWWHATGDADDAAQDAAWITQDVVALAAHSRAMMEDDAGGGVARGEAGAGGTGLGGERSRRWHRREASWQERRRGPGMQPLVVFAALWEAEGASLLLDWHAPWCLELPSRRWGRLPSTKTFVVHAAAQTNCNP